MSSNLTPRQQAFLNMATAAANVTPSTPPSVMANAVQQYNQAAQSPALSQQQGGTLPPAQSQPTKLYQPPSGSSPYTTSPTLPPQNVTPIQALSTIAATITPETPPSVMANAISTIYPEGRTVTSIQQAPQGFIVYSIPTPTTKQQGQPFVPPTAMNILTNPWGVFASMVNIGQVIAEKTPGLVGQYFQFNVGAAGELANQAKGVQNFIGNYIGQKQPLPSFTPHTQTEQIGMYATIGTELVGTAIASLGIAAPAEGIEALTAIQAVKTIALGPALGAGINVGVSSLAQGRIGTPVEVGEQAVTGAAFAVGGQGLLRGLSGVAATQMNPVGRVAAQLAWTAPGRIAVFTSMGTVVGYGVNPTPQGALTGAAFGFTFSAGGELLNYAGPKVTGKVSDYIGSKLIDVNLGRLENIDESYQQAYSQGVEWNPSKVDSLVMRVTGLRPLEPLVDIVALPTIETGEGLPEYGFQVGEAGTEGELIPKGAFGKTLTAASIAEPSSVLFGKSVEPSLPTIPTEAPRNLPEYTFTGEDLIREENNLSFIGGKPAVTRPNETFQRVGGFVKYPLGSDMTLNDLRANIENFPESQGEAATSKVIPEPSKGEYWNYGQQETILRNNPLAQEIVSGHVAVPTGVEKIVSDIQAGRTMDLARTYIPTQQAYNPAQYAGALYPGLRQRVSEETETTYLSVPASGLAHPQQPQFITDVTQKAQQEPASAQLAQPNLFTPQLTRSTQFNRVAESQMQIPTTDITQRQQPIQVPDIITIPTQTTPLIPITVPTQKTIDIPQPPTGKGQLPSFPFTFPGTKFPEFGGNEPNYPDFTGLLSIKRAYPIKTPEEFLGLPRRKKT